MTDTANRSDAAYAQIEAAHRSIALLRDHLRHREANRGFALAQTKLDEARLWLDEALSIAAAPEQPSANDRP
jgi:hypothetical protein